MSVPNVLAQSGGAGYYAGLVPNPFMLTLPRSLWDLQKDFFGYTATFNPLAASAAQSTQTVVQNDSAFVIVAAAMTVTDSPGDTTLSAFAPETVQISDQAAGTNFFDQPTHVRNVFGSQGSPLYWALPRLVQPGATITTTLQNLEATARIVRILYIGFKIFGYTTKR